MVVLYGTLISGFASRTRGEQTIADPLASFARHGPIERGGSAKGCSFYAGGVRGS